MLQRADAALIIGDPALRISVKMDALHAKKPSTGEPCCTDDPDAAPVPGVNMLFVYDVAAEWREWTGLPAVLVPGAFATGAHQDKNARWFAAAGGAVVVPEDEVGRVLSEEVRRFLRSDKLREEFLQLISGMRVEITAQVRLVPDPARKPGETVRPRVEVTSVRTKGPRKKSA